VLPRDELLFADLPARELAEDEVEVRVHLALDAPEVGAGRSERFEERRLAGGAVHLPLEVAQPDVAVDARLSDLDDAARVHAEVIEEVDEEPALGVDQPDAVGAVRAPDGDP